MAQSNHHSSVAGEHRKSSTGDNNDIKQQRAETRDVITPYAFEVAPELFGTPLASPARRGSALLIDLMLVGLLSGVTGNALAMIIAGLLWVSSRRIKREKGRIFAVRLLRMISMVLVVIAIVGFVLRSINFGDVYYSDEGNYSDIVNEESIKAVVLSGKYLLAANSIDEQVAQGKCASALTCWQNLADQFVEDLVAVELAEDIEQELLNQFLEYSASSLSPGEVSELDQHLKVAYQDNKPVAASSITPHEDQAKVTESPDQSIFTPDNQPVKDNQLLAEQDSELETGFYSIVAWVKGIAADLGLGFGWAAAYFTGTMVMFKGQTVGKKLLGIKVIKLDGSTLNVWESFGRYGGYGAGLATGLLGFLQIYWDPNRQAIQDKISETLVIRIEH